MPKIVPIVEGFGEVDAVPALLWKLLAEMGRYDIQIEAAQNAHGCRNLTVPGGVEKFVANAWTKRDCGAVLILMDAEEQCAMQLAIDFFPAYTCNGSPISSGHCHCKMRV